MVCKSAPGKTTRHHALNDAIARAFAAAGIPVSKEPCGLSPNDAKRPDGLTLIPWQGGKSLAWDVTVICTLADSYVSGSALVAGSASEVAAQRKIAKYADLPSSCIFQPLAVETLGPWNQSAVDCLNELGRRIGAVSCEDRESSFLFQRLSVLIQRFNSVLLRESFVASDETDL
jgi:hypothetical protein